ncbi:hypothetical protein C8R46DRAFT_1108560 [Mycena filopes]|nr:hypothetical protein C8R46DRAFT_1108560 [Mycena filopes]
MCTSRWSSAPAPDRLLLVSPPCVNPSTFSRDCSCQVHPSATLYPVAFWLSSTLALVYKSASLSDPLAVILLLSSSCFPVCGFRFLLSLSRRRLAPLLSLGAVLYPPNCTSKFVHSSHSFPSITSLCLLSIGCDFQRDIKLVGRTQARSRRIARDS